MAGISGHNEHQGGINSIRGIQDWNREVEEVEQGGVIQAPVMPWKI